MEFRLLDRSISKVIGGRSRALEGLDETDRWLLVSLLLEGYIDKQKITATTGLRDSTGAIRQRIGRLRRRTQLPIEASRSRGYSLDPAVVHVDALELLSLVERARKAPPEKRADLLRAGRRLWAGGLPEFSMGSPAPELGQRIESAHRECLTSGRQVLVVDDQIADSLAAGLRVDHVCETASSYEEYLRFEPDLARFDLVVLDRHLRAGYRDSTGDKIAERINRRADNTPVLMMTYKPPPETEMLEWELQLGLASAITKEHDGDEAYVERIVAAVNRLFRDGAVETACSRIQMSMVAHRRRAAKVLKEQHVGPALDGALAHMQAMAQLVEDKAARNDLAGARLARDGFLRQFGLA